MQTIIVTGQATTDALSGAAGVSNMITLYDAPKIRDVVSAKVVSRYDSSGTVTSVVSGVYGVTSGVFSIANFYPVARASLGSGVTASGQIAICSGVTASGATIQIATCSGGMTIGDQLAADHQLILKVSTRGEIVRK